MSCLPHDILKNEEKLNQHIEDDPQLYAYLFSNYLILNREKMEYSLNFLKINEFYKNTV